MTATEVGSISQKINFFLIRLERLQIDCCLHGIHLVGSILDSAAAAERDDMTLTDEDLHELKGCIELGFGFNEEEGQRLCPTLPALDLYFAVNRQISPSPVSSPNSGRHSTSSMGGPTSSFGGRSPSFGSPSPRSDSDGWKICSPGDNPQQVKIDPFGSPSASSTPMSMPVVTFSFVAVGIFS